MRGAPGVALAALVALGACGGGADSSEDAGGAATSRVQPNTAVGELTRLASPAGPGSGEPNLTVGSGGVYLSWLERAGANRHALRFSRLDGDTWSEPRTIIEREDLFVNWADFPAMLALEPGTLAAHWLQKSGPATYAYDVRMAVSTDSGRTWSEDVVPHGDGVQAEHGFVSLFPVGDSVGMVWLDGRNTPEGDPMTLRFTTVAANAETGPEVLLDGSTCDCCQTAAAIAEAGPVVAYRDRSAEEIRDIYVTRRVDGTWTTGEPVHRDGWEIAACPVNGPAAAAAGNRVAIAWFTGAQRKETTAGASQGDAASSGSSAGASARQGRVLVAFSDDGGASFGEPVQVDEGQPVGRVGLVLLDDGTAVVSWVEGGAEDARVRLRSVSPSGAGEATTLATTAAARASGFPRMARAGDRLFFAWTEAGNPAQVRTATARLEGEGRE